MIEAKAFFDRADLQQMIHFLLYGKEDANKNKGKYEASIHTVSIGILEKMHGLNLESDVYEKITNDTQTPSRTLKKPLFHSKTRTPNPKTTPRKSPH